VRESTEQSPLDRGEVATTGRCQICGDTGSTISVPAAPPPNEFCARCAIEYAEAPGLDDDAVP
jgi:hypothetical protein